MCNRFALLILALFAILACVARAQDSWKQQHLHEIKSLKQLRKPHRWRATVNSTGPLLRRRLSAASSIKVGSFTGTLVQETLCSDTSMYGFWKAGACGSNTPSLFERYTCLGDGRIQQEFSEYSCSSLSVVDVMQPNACDINGLKYRCVYANGNSYIKIEYSSFSDCDTVFDTDYMPVGVCMQGNIAFSNGNSWVIFQPYSSHTTTCPSSSTSSHPYHEKFSGTLGACRNDLGTEGGHGYTEDRDDNGGSFPWWTIPIGLLILGCLWICYRQASTEDESDPTEQVPGTNQGNSVSTWTTPQQAQQVYPVVLTGTLVPPLPDEPQQKHRHKHHHKHRHKHHEHRAQKTVVVPL